MCTLELKKTNISITIASICAAFSALIFSVNYNTGSVFLCFFVEDLSTTLQITHLMTTEVSFICDRKFYY